MVKLRQYYELRTTNYELRIELLSLSEGFEFDTKYEQEFIAFLKLNGATVQRALIETGHSSPRRRLAATSICVRHINGGHAWPHRAFAGRGTRSSCSSVVILLHPARLPNRGGRRFPELPSLGNDGRRRRACRFCPAGLRRDRR
jgi:hypothetical protein